MNDTLDRGRWRRIADILDRVLEAAEPERVALVSRLCRDDAELRAEVEAYLAAESRDGILAAQSGEYLATLFAEVGQQLADPGPESRLAGPYRLERELGRGGMGVVYLAERADGQFEQRVALKLVKRGLDSDEILARFLRERQILARLEHPAIARLLDGGVTASGQPYFALEHVEGEPLTEHCDRRRLSVEERLSLFRRVCEAVRYAHRNLVVHRDLKPANILVTAEGELKLLDFGIAKLLSDEGQAADATMTGPGVRPLTPAYAAPEQLRGEPVTTATDVYALGVVLYELLTGQRPHGAEGDSRAAVESAVLDTEPAPPSEAAARSDDGARARGTTAQALCRRLRGDLDTIAATALQKEPERRYPSVEALLDDLDRHLQGLPIRARPDSAAYRARKFVGRHRLGVAATLLIVLALVAGLAGTAWQARAKAREARRAEAVKDFLIGIFQVADPSQSRGEEVTARELLDEGAQRIEDELVGQPAIQADLLNVVGGIYETLGLSDRALPLVDRSLEIRHQLYGENHGATADSLRTKAVVLTSQGEHEAAEPLLRRALATHRERLGQTSEAVAEDLDELGTVLRAKGELDEAEAATRESLAIRRALYGERDLGLAPSLNNLAVMLREQGVYDEAESLYRESLAIRLEALGESHPDVADTRNNLATLMYHQGRNEEAEALFRQTGGDYQRLYGDDHPRTVMARNNLAAVLQRLGQYTEAQSLYREVLDYWRENAGDSHPNAVVTLNNLAVAVRQAGQLEEADRLLEELVGKWRELVGDSHQYTAVSLTHWAVARRELGDPESAARLAEEALSIRRSLFGDRHPDIASSLHELATQARERGALAEAERLYREALAMRTELLGEDNSFTGQTLAGLGATLVETGTAEEGLDLLRRALTRIRAGFPEGHPEIASTALQLGSALTALGRAEQARALLEEAVRIRSERFGADTWQTAAAQVALGSCLAAEGSPDEARALLAAASETLRRERGDGHRSTRAARRALATLPAG